MDRAWSLTEMNHPHSNRLLFTVAMIKVLRLERELKVEARHQNGQADGHEDVAVDQTCLKDPTL